MRITPAPTLSFQSTHPRDSVAITALDGRADSQGRMDRKTVYRYGVKETLAWSMFSDVPPFGACDEVLGLACVRMTGSGSESGPS